MKKSLVSLLGLSLVLAVFVGCGAVKDEKQSFIDATVKATCLIFESEDLFDPALEEQTKKIFDDYGFDVEDEAAMLALTAKYEGDEEVQASILAELEKCSAGIFEGLSDATTDEALIEETPAVEEELIEETTTEETVVEETTTEETVVEETTTEETVVEETPVVE